tara:strand:- start:5329 stop:6294 length:966 start_codon:yes stop_codon:yes gene_type:complete
MQEKDKIFDSFLEDIKTVFPEYKERINNYYNKSNEEEYNEKFSNVLRNINKISDKIINKNIDVFNDDPIILENVSFKLIWTSEITDETKNNLWKYLQTFCIMNINNESSNEKIQEVLKQIETKEKIKDKKTFENMKKLQKLQEKFDIQKIEQVINENSTSINDNLEEMDQMFQDTSIGKLAKEITEDLNIDELIRNGNGIEDLFSGGNMTNIMQTISSKMTNSEGNLDTKDLINEATNICNSMQGNPLFSSLMGMQSDLFKNQEKREQGGQRGQREQETTKNVQIKGQHNHNPNHNPNVTKERLQRKLKEKKKDLVVNKKD